MHKQPKKPNSIQVGKKNEINPFIEVRGPGDTHYKFDLKNVQTIIGRLQDVNEIALEPDPQKLVTRHMHCAIEIKSHFYWVVDNASKNGTFLKRLDVVKRILGEEKLQHRDTIRILANIESNGEHKYWELQFIDPQTTEGVLTFTKKQHLEYDWVQAKLFLINGTIRTEIGGLTPQEHKLIRYMEQQNKNNENTTKMCTYEELLAAIWDEQQYTHTKNDIARLIWGLRKKIEIDHQNPVFLINVRGIGYRLIINASV
ncbi:MAG: winged helix-turn-helix domain-containing protein [Deltaproteobacteria bacterium]|nr:winged helix-turn-helix domain-containing protein [Deltaproteobacteria bacterium]